MVFRGVFSIKYLVVRHIQRIDFQALAYLNTQYYLLNTHYKNLKRLNS